MTAQARISGKERRLEHAVRGLCNLITKLQIRAAEYLPDGDRDAFINDMLAYLDGPEQREVQSKARALLNEPHVQIPLRRK
jgi:hypothetical protein